jgi:hypothetical protein
MATDGTCAPEFIDGDPLGFHCIHRISDISARGVRNLDRER